MIDQLRTVPVDRNELLDAPKRDRTELSVCVGQRAAFLAGGIRPPVFWPGDVMSAGFDPSKQDNGGISQQETLF